MSGETELSEVPNDEDAESKRSRRMERNARIRIEEEREFERAFKKVEDEMRHEGATDKEIQRKKNAYRRLSGPFGTHAWHADGTPYTEENYIRANMEVPLDVDEQKPIRVAPLKRDASDL